jgi:hypothetical protein
VAPATATPTRTPVPPTATSVPPTATSVPPQVPRFTSTGSVSPTNPTVGQTVTLTVRVTGVTAANVLVDVEVYDSSGQKVLQGVYDNQAFTAGQTRTYSPTWTVPASAVKGTYWVKVGVFQPGWGTIYHWNDSLSIFTVN